MSDWLHSPQFDSYRNHVDRARQNGWNWDQVRTLSGMDAVEMDRWFETQIAVSFWPRLGNTPAERRNAWIAIVTAKEAAEADMLYATRPLVILGREETEPGIQVPEDEHTSWQLYRRYLLGNGWKPDSIDSIEASSLRILRRLRRKTKGMSPVRGMVVGHVQSGKTASMAGLTAMAADQGWNVVIVLSGTLENLRLQTMRRLVKDLSHPGNLHWTVVERPSKDSHVGNRAQDLHFGNSHRHLIVSLKNPTRLKNLLEWLKADPRSLDTMKVLIIDDEADQAGINTAPINAADRTTINKLIVALTKVAAQAVNYVAYTATPTANFLNESPGGEALYPEDFIVSLQQSNEHFGPLQIFGAPESDQQALGIVEDITLGDLVEVRAVHDDPSVGLPLSFEEAVMWFVCSAAALRVYGIAKPVSMLIHTSQLQTHHANAAAAVEKFLRNGSANIEGFIAACRVLWDRMRQKFSLEDFAERFSTYGRLHDIPQYPEFSALESHIVDLLGEISAIRLSEDGDLAYHRGIHVCIDNCANNGVNDENEIRRLFYPDPDSSTYPTFTTAFIVVGGSTLARGLTIENLVSTYFLRASVQADSLMQMGRWFGYRKGYELLPRIWMPVDTRRKFEFMTLAEEDLRDDLKRFMEAGASPAEFGPRVRVHPRASWLRPTAKNRMQAALGAEYDFSGLNRQTTVFHAGGGHADIARRNLERTNAFLSRLARLGRASVSRPAVVWDGVGFERIAEFLQSFEFHPRAQFFSEIELFLKWWSENAAKAGYTEWNVVVAGKHDERGAAPWPVPGGTIQKITRTRLKDSSDDNSVSIGVLRDPLDLLADVGTELESGTSVKSAAIDDRRKNEGLGSVPQLLIYLIDKSSVPTPTELAKEEEDRVRLPLGVTEDIIGISIWLPPAGEVSKSHVTHLTVRVPDDLAQVADDAEAEPNEGNAA
ncbi:MAG: endonuclease, protein [Massilia sp.]|nr:endonuclease, protein [Massilia sp.]